MLEIMSVFYFGVVAGVGGLMGGWFFANWCIYGDIWESPFTRRRD